MVTVEKAGKLKSTKRFGVRYGTTTKQRLDKVEALYKKPQACPCCLKKAIHKRASGIWECRKCGLKIAGRAFSIGGIANRNPKIVLEAEQIITKEITEEKINVQESAV